ncbi:NO-inducible flavohemoprotein [Alicyclobacillus fastidiosus]|uniref:Flavohemoprotein n=1 Tax=Alicyclobacillus fastidiosus TaxID=392011 RepID=A0ABV5AKE8_9BACL|nr:NO-inducible flavohemoprotein [Alicyclobacillus fastidiosus]WEH08460.1 NO-inducible flavohemoprotein [Alicyclobacillus fastidiosus]
MLSQETRDIIKSTVPVLETHGTAITTRFYQLLFESHPELLNIFNKMNQRKGDQQTALANAVYAAAAHIDHLEDILPAVKQISNKHRALGIVPEHYPIVGENLLKAIKDVLGDAATDEIIDAWAQAYGAIADVFISVEHEMYREAETQKGGWRGFRPFVVQRKVPESEVISSFYLVPQDGKEIADFLPGQYLTFKVDIPGEKYNQRRHYSLSDAPGQGYYRISVKREEGRGDIPDGLVSSYLHNHLNEGDVLYVSAPSGDFVMKKPADKPVVFLSGGVGMTPLVSMVKTLLQEQPGHPVTYVHAAIHGGLHALQEDLNTLADTNTNLHYHVVYEKPSEKDKSHKHFSKEGFIDLDWLNQVVSADSDFYFCGPTPWIVNTKLDNFLKVDGFVFDRCRVTERTVNSDVVVPVYIVI